MTVPVFPPGQPPTLEGGLIHTILIDTLAQQDLVQELSACLPAAEYTRSELIHDEKARQDYFLSRGLMRKVLSLYLGLDPQEVNLASGYRGKPQLKGKGKLFFNSSHSGDMIAFSLTAGSELGVDVEWVRELDDMEGMIRTNHSDNEKTYFQGKSPEERVRLFFDFWTGKEAYMKYTGEGAHLPPEKIELCFRDGNLHLASILVTGEHDDVYFSSFSPRNDYAGCVVTGHSGEHHLWSWRG